MRRVHLVLLLLGLVWLLPVPLGKAQSSSASPTPLPDISALRLQYRQSLDDYRTKEDLFSIASQQYYALKTLAAQEEAVRATRGFELSRVDTILTYIQNLRVSLDTNIGIEISRKAALQNEFDLLVTDLKAHRSRTEIAIDRIQVEAENIFLQGQQDNITTLSYRALSLIKIGAAQSALDQLVVTQQAINEFIATAPISETTRLEKQRGSDELTRSISNIKTSLVSAIAAYDEGAIGADSSLLHKVQEALGVAYGNLTQSLEFVKELNQ